MKTILLSLFCLFCLWPYATKAQEWQTISSAEQLHQRQLHISAALQFRQEIEKNAGHLTLQSAQLASYRLIGLLQENYPQKEVALRQWELDWPSAPYKSEIYYLYASSCCDEGNYATALKYFDKINSDNLDKKLREDAGFKKAYSLFCLGRVEEALPFFTRLEKSSSKEIALLSKYYRAYIYYSQKRFQEALPLLESLEKDPLYSALVPVYSLECRFYLGRYREVIEQGEELFNTVHPSQKSAVARLLSESYFSLGHAKEASEYFEQYRSQNTSFSRSDNYFSGMLYYALGQYDSSAKELETAATVADSLGQCAHYHLGKAYIELSNKQSALEHFKKASEMDFDPVMKEDALFNYAKASFDVNGDIRMMHEYCRLYPNSAKQDELLSYTATAYLMQKDYQSAIDAIQAISHPTRENLQSLQRAQFLRGMQLYEAHSHRQAQSYFRQAATSSGSSQTAFLAQNWLAESLFADKSFDSARKIWQQLQQTRVAGTDDIRRNCLYNIAYTYFEEKQYEAAQTSFQDYLINPTLPEASREDAQVRLGDCLFMQALYHEALDAYSLAQGDYALYQKAFCLGLLNRDEEKIHSLEQLQTSYPQSSLLAAALFEKGRTRVRTSETELAIQCFEEILGSEEYSNFHARSLVELGLIALNLGETDKALEYYKSVMSRYPGSPEADNALAGIENIYLSRNDSPAFFAYLEQLGIDSGKGANEKENLIFASAEKNYISGNYRQATIALDSFLVQYPGSPKTTAAHFYLGESLLQTGNPEQAADHFMNVLEDEQQSSFTELSALQYARIQYRLQNYTKAAQAYQSLEKLALIENNRAEAIIGAMRSWYYAKEYENALVSALKVAENNAENPDDIEEATYIRAKSHLALSQREEALPLLQTLAKNPQNPEGAEASYLICKDAFDSGRLDEAETLIYNFSDTESPQEYWIAQSFILLGDIYAHRGEYKQAIATYQSILDQYHSTGKDDIARLVSHRIEQCRKKTENTQANE